MSEPPAGTVTFPHQCRAHHFDANRVAKCVRVRIVRALGSFLGCAERTDRRNRTSMQTSSQQIIVASGLARRSAAWAFLTATKLMTWTFDYRISHDPSVDHRRVDGAVGSVDRQLDKSPRLAMDTSSGLELDLDVSSSGLAARRTQTRSTLPPTISGIQSWAVKRSS
jgi:hypothetical protein